MKKLVFLFFLLFSGALWCQEESSLLISKNTFSFRDGYLISSPYHSMYDRNGWLWILGENKLSNEYILGEQEIIIQRFDGANFFTLKLPNTYDKKIKGGHFFKHKPHGLYLKLYYQAAREELFYINTETLEISAVEDYNNLNENYLISKAYPAGDFNRIVLTSNDKFYSATLDKLSLRFIDSIPFDKPVAQPILADPITTDNYTLIKLLFQNEGYFLNKEGKFIKKIVETDFEAIDGTHFFPKTIHTSFKVNNAFYAYLDNYENVFKFNKTLKKFIEIPNSSNLLSKNKALEFTPDFKHAFSTEIFSDYTAIELYRFKDFQKELLTKIEIKSFSETAYREFGKDLVVLNGNTLEPYSFIESKIKTFLKGKSIRTIKKLKENKYIVATDAEGFYKIDVKENTEERIKILAHTAELAINYSRDIFIKKDNTFIIGDSENLYTLDSNYEVIQDETVKIRGEEIIKINDTLFTANPRGGISKYSINEKRYTKIANTNAIQVKEFTTDGTRLYGTSSKGIFEYENGTFNTYEFENVETDNLLSINHLEDYGILVSTKFGKIYTFDTRTKKLKLFYEDELNASIVGMVADGTGTLWLNTYAGIVSLELSSKQIIRYTKKDGVYELKGNMFSTYKDEQDGSIFMGSYKGLRYFKPDELVENNIDVQPQFTSISFFNSENDRWEINTSPSFLNNTSEIVLPSEYRRFSATLSVFGQMNTQDIKYRYRLLNSDNNADWFTTYSGKEILFANLAAGTYTLQVETYSASRQKIGETIALKIISKEVFYKTWWFILLLLLFVSISVLYLFYQYKVKQNLFAKNEIALNEAKIKNTMMLEIHHRIKNNLQIVSGLLGLQMAKSSNAELKVKLQDSQSRIESIAGIHNLLYNSNNQDFISVKENIENCVTYYKKLFPINATYHLDIDTSILSINQATPFSLLLNELINNSNKHAFAETEKPAIYIHFEKRDKKYVFEYFDNGNFKNQESQKQAMGMKIIEMMNKQLKGDLRIENTTNFKLTLLFSTNE
ncbi:histidine kinase dimerization/phosphoacceptor domain -containing protein [Salegentibacter salegens]|uniref:histidine kinase n=1 Tax=Salegentibacter salegens TaxID=143223 RepID=A0A1M7N3Q0_9FLAO|nr:histidine kinase dimerization/phosphoacceptor domain -containing protein [Salegentibacter salegens]PRX52363.1 two-component sensor histidine kinase [Salegentibacter salegens]SHM97637.1 Two-component sensor histidine kinase, contains HisKA and HATPase domains [Salegentibacter salegens]